MYSTDITIFNAGKSEMLNKTKQKSMPVQHSQI